jgi:hypothetical protein
VNSLGNRDLLFWNPTVGIFSVEGAPRGSRIDTGERIDGSDEPIGAESKRDSGIEQRAEGISGGSALVTDAFLCLAAVVDGVIGLH